MKAHIAASAASLALAFGVPSLAAVQTATVPSGPVPNAYIVTFKPTNGANVSPILPGRQADPKNGVIPAIGEHTSGQDKAALAKTLGIRGSVRYIFDNINSAYLSIEPDEAERLQRDPQVLTVEQARYLAANQTTQFNPGWALDRLDQSTTVLNYQHVYTTTGAGHNIYVFDSGLTVTNVGVQAEFEGRASIEWDVNGLGGNDCTGHGTMMASAAAGNVYGMAKGARLRALKITQGCSLAADSGVIAMLFNFLADWGPKKSIFLLSYSVPTGFGCPTQLDDPNYTISHLDDAIAYAHDKGMIIVVSAGNDDCDTAYFTPARNPKAFVVGATSAGRLSLNQDAKLAGTRTGANISTFAPGGGVPVLGAYGTPEITSGTSPSAAYIAGMFAVGCPVPPATPPGSFCLSNPVPTIYAYMRWVAATGTVVMPNGAALPSNTTSRFNNRAPW